MMFYKVKMGQIGRLRVQFKGEIMCSLQIFHCIKVSFAGKLPLVRLINQPAVNEWIDHLQPNLELLTRTPAADARLTAAVVSTFTFQKFSQYVIKWHNDNKTVFTLQSHTETNSVRHWNLTDTIWSWLASHTRQTAARVSYQAAAHLCTWVPPRLAFFCSRRKLDSAFFLLSCDDSMGSAKETTPPSWHTCPTDHPSVRPLLEKGKWCIVHLLVTMQNSSKALHKAT